MEIQTLSGIASKSFQFHQTRQDNECSHHKPDNNGLNTFFQASDDGANKLECLSMGSLSGESNICETARPAPLSLD